jgi:hypothetical protein
MRAVADPGIRTLCTDCTKRNAASRVSTRAPLLTGKPEVLADDMTRSVTARLSTLPET